MRAKESRKTKKTVTLNSEDWARITARATALMAGHKFGCSEAVMLAFQETLGRELLPPAAVALASAFRGGMGGAGCTCGALAAGQMVLGSIFGYHGDGEGQQDPEKVKAARQLYQELHDLFKKSHKSTCCRLLTKGLAPNSPESREKCAALAGSAAALTGGLIAREAARIPGGLSSLLDIKPA